MLNGRLIAPQRQQHQPVGPVVVGQVVLHRVILGDLDAQGIAGGFQLVRRLASGTELTHIGRHLLQFLHTALLDEVLKEVCLLHQPVDVGRPVVHNPPQLSAQLQHPLVPVANARPASFQFVPLRQDLHVRHPVIAVHAVLILIQLHLPEVVCHPHLLMALSSISFTEIKQPLRIPLTVLLPVLFVV